MNNVSFVGKDGSLKIFKGINEIETDFVNSLTIERIKDTTTTIKINNKSISFPSRFEVLQTEHSELDFVKSTELLPIPIFSTIGKLAINEVYDYKVYVDSNVVEWVIPSVKRGTFIVVACGIVLNPKPIKSNKFIIGLN
jgi:hypothetical protein